MKKAQTSAETQEALIAQLEAVGWMRPEKEHRFHERLWRFDLAYPQPKVMLAIEIEGGSFMAGRHSRGAGFKADVEKYAEAMCLGWRILRITPDNVKSGEACDWVGRILTRDWAEVDDTQHAPSALGGDGAGGIR